MALPKNEQAAKLHMTKVAVTGTQYCGKTMFLTSLLWQLEELDETRFHLPDGIAVRGFHPQNVRERDEVFPLNRFRNVLAREYKWPEKTKDAYHARMTDGGARASAVWCLPCALRSRDTR